MNALAVLPHFTDEMRSWMIDQLIWSRPRAQIVSDFMDRYPDFGAGLALEVIERRLRSRLKEMVSRGKSKDEIIAGREALKEADSSSGEAVLCQPALDNRRAAYLERMEEIDWLLSNDKTFSSEQRKALKEEFIRKNIMRQQLDAAERSERRRRDDEIAWDFKGPVMHVPDDEPSEAQQKPTPALDEPQEPEPKEPKWYEIPDPDVEHLTV